MSQMKIIKGIGETEQDHSLIVFEHDDGPSVKERLLGVYKKLIKHLISLIFSI